MSRFGSTSLVTDHRLYEVGSKGRKRVTNAAVSARSSSIVRESFTVTQKDKYTITRQANQHLTLKSDFPVKAVFIQGSYEEPEHGNDVPTYEPAELFTPSLEFGHNLIEVVDDSVKTDSVKVSVMNLRTGESEIITAERDRETGKFLAVLYIVYGGSGRNFDCQLEAEWEDTIIVQYQELAGVEVNLHTDRRKLPDQPDLPSFITPLDVRPNSKFSVATWQQVDEITITRGTDVTTVPMEFDGTFWHTTINLAGYDVDEVEISAAIHFGVVTNRVEVTVPVTDKSEQQVRILPSNRVLMQDSDRNGREVEVIVADSQDQFQRVKLNRVLDGLGTYIGDWKPTVSGDYYVLYVNTSQEFVRSEVVEVNVDAMPDIETEIDFECEPEQAATPVLAPNRIEMEINGLFVLNGRFSGAIEITAVQDEVVHCQLVLAK